MNHPVNEPLLPLLSPGDTLEFEPGDRVRVRADVKSGHAGQEFVVEKVEKGFLKTIKKGITHRFPLKWAEPVESVLGVQPLDADLIPHTPDKPMCGIKNENGAKNALEIPHTLESEPCAELKEWAYTEDYLSHSIIYVRFRWGKGSVTAGYVHISGGNSANPTVQERRSRVDEMVQRGCSVAEIEAAIRGFPKARRGRKPF